jgi:hypothetical protein
MVFDFLFLFEHEVFFLKKYFRFRSVQRKLIGDFFDNSQQAANCSVRFFFLNFFVFWRIARMTEQLK